MSAVLPFTSREAIDRGTDGHFKAKLIQLTSEPVTSHNIYCEERYCSADGTRIAIMRCPFGAERQLWVIDLPTRRLVRVHASVAFGVTSPLKGDALYFVARHASGAHVVHRVNLMTLDCVELFALPQNGPQVLASGTMSVDPGETCLVSACHLKGVRYGLLRLELATGKVELIHERDDMCNSHHQFEPGTGRKLLVQLNRGCEVTEQGAMLKLVGEEGATLYVLDIASGQVQDLPLGRPYDGGVTGHECWVADTGSIILTLFTQDKQRLEVHRVAPGDRASQCLARGPMFIHISASTDGRFWVADDMANSKLYVGSLRTGRMLPLCDSGASFGASQPTHPHAYLAPDNRHVIFNSDRTGVSQVWAAEVPAGFLDALEW